MPPPVRIDPATGCITFGEYVIPLGSNLSDLAKGFDRTEARTRVGDVVVPRILASRTIEDQGVRFELWLAYAARRLTNASLVIEPEQFRNMPDEAFYTSTDARRDYHARWLASMGIPGSGHTEMPWGAVGVACDKSENVFIYLHARGEK